MSSRQLLDGKDIKREVHVTYPRALHLRRAGDFSQLESTLRRVETALKLDVIFSDAKSGTYTCGFAPFDEVLSRSNTTPKKLVVESQGASRLDFNETGALWISHPRVQLVTSRGTSSWVEASSITVRIKGSMISVELRA